MDPIPDQIHFKIMEIQEIETKISWLIVGHADHSASQAVPNDKIKEKF